MAKFWENLESTMKHGGKYLMFTHRIYRVNRSLFLYGAVIEKKQGQKYDLMHTSAPCSFLEWHARVGQWRRWKTGWINWWKVIGFCPVSLATIRGATSFAQF